MQKTKSVALYLSLCLLCIAIAVIFEMGRELQKSHELNNRFQSDNIRLSLRLYKLQPKKETTLFPVDDSIIHKHQPLSLEERY